MEARFNWMLLCLAVWATFGCSSASTNDADGAQMKSNTHALIKEFYKCASKEGLSGLVSCASYRALKMLQYVDKEASYEILPGIALVREATAGERTAKEINVQELPTDAKLKATKLVDMLIDTASKFVSSRSLKIKVTPDTTNQVGRAFEEQVRQMSKIKKYGSIFSALGTKLLVTFPLLLGGLGLLATKALIIGKLAFVIAAVLFVQYYFGLGRGIIGSPYGGYTPYGTPSTYGAGAWTTNNIGGYGNQYPYARSIEVPETGDAKTAQDMAYSAQRPQ